jgi:hypothetical protein
MAHGDTRASTQCGGPVIILGFAPRVCGVAWLLFDGATRPRGLGYRALHGKYAVFRNRATARGLAVISFDAARTACGAFARRCACAPLWITQLNILACFALLISIVDQAF